MGGDHKCPVCQATFTRPQHVARHMRSHTGDRPYKCSFCGDQFARSDLLSRHVNKCHAGEKPPPNGAAGSANGAGAGGGGGSKRGTGKRGVVGGSRAITSKQACDQCVQGSLPCDGCNPCGKCVSRKVRCTFVKFHRQTAPAGPGHSVPASSLSSLGSSLSSASAALHGPVTVPGMRPGPGGGMQLPYDQGQHPHANLISSSLPSSFSYGFQYGEDFSAKYRANAELLSRIPPPNNNNNGSNRARPSTSSSSSADRWADPGASWDPTNQFAFNIPPSSSEPSSRLPSIASGHRIPYDPPQHSQYQDPFYGAGAQGGMDMEMDPFQYRPSSSHSSSSSSQGGHDFNDYRPSSSSSSIFSHTVDSRPSSSAGLPAGGDGYDYAVQSRPGTRSGEQVNSAFGLMSLDGELGGMGPGVGVEGAEFFTGLPPQSDPNATPMPLPGGVDPISQHVLSQHHQQPPSQQHDASSSSPSPHPSSSSSSDMSSRRHSFAGDPTNNPFSNTLPPLHDHSPIPQHLHPSSASQQQQQQQQSNQNTTSSSLGKETPRETELRELREFWRTYMRSTPLASSAAGSPGFGAAAAAAAAGGGDWGNAGGWSGTGFTPGAAGDLGLGSGTGAGSGAGGGGSSGSGGRHHRRQRTNSLPSVKTPLGFGDSGRGYMGSGSGEIIYQGQGGQHHDHPQHPQHPPQGQGQGQGQGQDDLRSYQEAVLNRKMSLNLNMPGDRNAPNLRFNRGNKQGVDSTSPSAARPMIVPSQTQGHEENTGGATGLSSRPSFKRLASQTLGPDNTKSRKMSSSASQNPGMGMFDSTGGMFDLNGVGGGLGNGAVGGGGGGFDNLFTPTPGTAAALGDVSGGGR